MAGNDAVLDFRGLVGAIRNIDNEFASQAGRAVNVCLTLRNSLLPLRPSHAEKVRSVTAQSIFFHAET
jgi:hypothetical protein